MLNIDSLKTEMTVTKSAKLTKLSLLCIALINLSACTMDDVKRNAYDSLYQRNCLDRYGVPDCDPQKKSYDRYQYDRDQSLSKNKGPL